MKKIFSTMLFLGLLALPAHAQIDTSVEDNMPNREEKSIVVLRGIDKITTRLLTIEIPVGQTVKSGTLEITARKCFQNAPEEEPETTAFLEIYDTPPDSITQQIFSGWLFASSPSISAFDHPVYDLWVVDCKNQ